jgi:D-xylose transport system permease protein
MSTAATPQSADPTESKKGDALAQHQEQSTLGGEVRKWWEGVRAGDYGSLPIFVGLIIIAIVFRSQNSNFLTSQNILNLGIQAAGYMTIAMGVTFVLLLGEIDLSIGYVSGVGGAIAALLTLPDGAAFAGLPAIVVALLAGLAIGTLHGVLFTKVGIPSFVVTLAGLLAWNGAVLLLIGSRGTVVIQSKLITNLANGFISDAAAWIIVVVAIVAYAGIMLLGRAQRAKAGLPLGAISIVAAKVIALAVVLAVVVWWVNKDRGVPYIFLVLGALFIFWTYVLNRTKFGRHVYAVGGNAEAARRAGINVDLIRIACFAIASLMATFGGIVLASRLVSVDTGAGGGQILLYSIAAAVIGGTSLFGGRGYIKAAVLGAIVIASIDNGLGLLNLSSGVKFVITGLVLLAAVTIDSLSRRNLASSGRA